MADFDVFGSQDGGDFQVSGSWEWFANAVQVSSTFAFTNSAAIKRTTPVSVASRFAFTSAAAFKKTTYFTANSAFTFSTDALIQRKARVVQISIQYTAPIVRVVA